MPMFVNSHLLSGNNTIAFVDPHLFGVRLWFANHTLLNKKTLHQQCFGCDGYLIFAVTTAVDFDADSLPSGSSVSVTVNQLQSITANPGKLNIATKAASNS